MYVKLLIDSSFIVLKYTTYNRILIVFLHLTRYMEREFSSNPVDTLQNLHNAVIDGLVIETITVGCKGTKAGVEQEGYWIPDKEQV